MPARGRASGQSSKKPVSSWITRSAPTKAGSQGSEAPEVTTQAGLPKLQIPGLPFQGQLPSFGGTTDPVSFKTLKI